MSQDDLRINRDVRKILVKHWLDLGRLSVRSSLGKLTIRGSLDRIRGVKEELTPAIVNDMFNKIKSIKDVVRLHVDLDNWADDGGRWVQVDKGRSALLNSRGSSSAGAGSAGKKKDRTEEDKRTDVSPLVTGH